MSPSVVLQHYQVAIIGGGIAGLTTALALERLGIRYILFERHESLAPDEGASIGLLPNGLRILDQLGLMEEIEKHTTALQRWQHLDGDGALLSEVNALGYYPSTIGYGGLFLERRKLLRIMADGLKSVDSIRTGTRVTSVRETSEQAILTTSDGIRITADLVIGADGVRSCVRPAIDQAPQGSPGSSDDYMSTRFACVYGISPPVEGIIAGDCFSVYRPAATILIFTGKGGTVFWFVFEDLGQTYTLSTTPQYTTADVEKLCRSVSHLRITPTVRFGDVYEKRSVAVKVALEEGVAPNWHSEHMVVVGDAAHKMVPNAAMGANQAIESATVLLNELHSVLCGPSQGYMPHETLTAALKQYANSRKLRTAGIVQKAGITCRAQLAHDGPAAALRHELPSLTDGDWLFRGFMGLADAPVLAGIPLSQHGLLYQQAVDQFRKRVRARENEGLNISNMELFDTEGI
ncbi:hypothetical protein EYZ11_003557 [Aspergillus tanneri]|uniref:FAD-binding domain-containing protein n=1 Tax=Aspergillus tanneri TaxID=1220188 RepID=A0A4S3JMS9_9EURO|nr:hypothetical protein EYZ11_003557 [Aspergillus tanneri]